ncbi:MAG: hypothetical protein U9R26_01405 [Campylobacterota bacterium]|nr:hypothetical protein [Campylobacterota bacterium]
MKKIFINFVILTVVAFSSAATQEIDRMIAEIKEPRKGIALKELSSIPNPFVTIKKDVNITEVFVPKKREENMELGGIVNRKAYINGAWHKEGDDVSGYTLQYVGTRGVVLVDAARIKRLFLHEKREDIITIKEGM